MFTSSSSDSGRPDPPIERRGALVINRRSDHATGNQPSAPATAALVSAAACKGLSPDLFFPDRGQDVSPAREVCAGCPVQHECLEDALANREKFGVWGALSERERRIVRRDRRRQERRTA